MQIILNNGTVLTPSYEMGDIVAHILDPETPDIITSVTILGTGGFAYLTASAESYVCELELVPHRGPKGAIGYTPTEGEDENLG